MHGSKDARPLLSLSVLMPAHCPPTLQPPAASTPSFGGLCAPLHRENNFIKDFPQLADGLLVIPLPVEEQCRGVLSEPLPDLQLLTGKTHLLDVPQPLSLHLWPLQVPLHIPDGPVQASSFLRDRRMKGPAVGQGWASWYGLCRAGGLL